MADLAWFSGLFLLFCSSPGLLIQPPFLTRKKETFGEDIFVLWRVRAFHRYPFVDLEVSYDVLSPLPIVLSKHFNHPHPYIEFATVISDVLQVHRIQGMGNTDTLHPNSCFCFFPSLHLKYLK